MGVSTPAAQARTSCCGGWLIFSAMVLIETTRSLFRLVEAYYVQTPEDVDTLKKCLRINKILYIRQAPILLNLGDSAAWYRPIPTVLLDLRRDMGELFREASRTCRNRIARIDRLSGRASVRRNDPAAHADFLKLHNAFVARSRHTEPLSKSQIDRLRPIIDVFVAYFDGRALCGHVFIRDQYIRRVELLFSASVRLERNESPAFVSWLNRWLHWFEIRLYKSEGMLVYDFGGTATDTPRRAGIARFKHSFGGTRVVEHSYIAAGPLGRMAISMFYAMRRIRSARSVFGVSGLFEHPGWIDIRRAQ
jgi:hypothetical protein